MAEKSVDPRVQPKASQAFLLGRTRGSTLFVCD